MTRLIRNWSTCCLVAALAVAGCTDTTSSETSGSLSLSLELAEGVTINEVDWTISGGDMAPMSGVIDTSAPGATASVEVFGLPPGEDYLVELEATDETGEITCAGSAEFDVEIGVATDVMVMLNCKLPTRLGGVRVNGKFNVCAELAKAVVSPLQTSVGNDIDLSAQTVDVEGDAVTIVWSATGGSIADSNAAETTYTCGEVGDQSITVTVSDDDFVYCMDDWTVAVTCVEGDGDLCEGVTCEDDGNDCTVESCNPATGQCESASADDGTECDDGAGMCMDGECIASDLCEGVDCDDQNECTDDVCNPTDGSCSNEPVDDGTSCNDGAGMCVEGACMDSDLCEGVTCDDTGNDCTVAECNNQTGECEVMDVPDGTECNGGAGACSAGECVDDNLCDGVDCTSANDCVQDGTCDPATGQCIPGGNEPADTACDGGAGVCDGAGACVECNAAAQCPDDGNECTVSVCDGNACGTENAMEGAACDFMGGDGICEAGTCVEAPECTAAADCDDSNECTLETCDNGSCVYEPLNGGTCDANGAAGTCDNGQCVEVDLCEGVDCDDQNECTTDSCDSADGSCSNDPVADGTSCDGGNGTCQEGSCEPNDVTPDPVTQAITLGCTNNLTTDISILPWVLTAAPQAALVDGQPVSIDYDGVALFTETFLDAGLAAVPGLNSAALNPGNRGGSTIVPRAGLSGGDASGLEIEPAPIPTTCDGGMNAGGACTTDSDCPPVGYFNCLEIAELPTLNTEAECDALGPPKDTQFDNNGFCIAGPLELPLEQVTGSYTAAASPNVLIGWDETNQSGLNPDGTYILNAASFSAPWQPAGLRVVVGVLQIALNCVMAVDSGGPDGVSVPDQASPTPDSALISFPVQ